MGTMSEEERFDGMLMSMAQQQKGIEPLLDTVFSFLRRKTDFFSGADYSQIEQTVLKSVKKHAALAEKDAYDREARKKQAAAKVKAVPIPPKEPPRFEEITDDAEPTDKDAESADKDAEDEGKHS